MGRFASDGLETDHQVHEEGRTLAIAAARTVTGNSQADFECIPDCTALICKLETTNVQTLAGDTLNVLVQTYIGGTWIDVCAFTQVLGNGADAQIHIAKLMSQTAEAMFASGALAAGTIRHLLGTRWAAYWTIVGTGSFTFSVKIQPIK